MSDDEQQLLQIYRALGEEERSTLSAFAAFLAQNSSETVSREIPAVQDIPRPAEESVVAALKRLAATYPMLDKSKMLHQTAALVAEHVMQGRPASEVIDQLEAVFQRHYARLTGTDTDV